MNCFCRLTFKSVIKDSSVLTRLKKTWTIKNTSRHFSAIDNYRPDPSKFSNTPTTKQLSFCKSEVYPVRTYCNTHENGNEHKQKLGAIEGKLLLSYKCKVCGTKNQETFTKLAYTNGVVIVTCQGCKNNHLIADHLGWFKDVKGRTIEEILANKGEVVKKVMLDGGMELIPKTEEEE